MDPVEIDAIPATVEEFLELRDELAATPEGAAMLMVLALLKFATDEDVGRQFLAMSVHSESLWDGPEGYKGKQLSRGSLRLIGFQIHDRSYIVQSYFQGTSLENGYKLPGPPYRFEYSTNRYSGDPESGKFKLFIHSSGADMPRPVTVKKDDDGFWKTAEWTSLIVGVKEPENE